MEFFTIGVYNSDEKDFFGRIIENGIDTFADIRQRRGVRGARYSFVNSNRLQNKLQELGIRYDHIKGLAPTSEIRSIQEKTDKQQKINRKERTHISGSFARAFINEVLNRFDFGKYLQQQEEAGAKKIVIFCVEEHPEACHRSIVAEKLKALGYKVTHL